MDELLGSAAGLRGRGCVASLVVKDVSPFLGLCSLFKLTVWSLGAVSAMLNLLWCLDGSVRGALFFLKGILSKCAP